MERVGHELLQVFFTLGHVVCEARRRVLDAETRVEVRPFEVRVDRDHA